MRTIETTSGAQVTVDADEPVMLDLLDAIRETLESRATDYDTEDAVGEIRALVAQMTPEETAGLLREFMHFAWFRYDEDLRDISAKLKNVR
jgi:hypothetical protein